MASGGLKCIQCLMFISNLLFALLGILIILVGISVQFNYTHYSNFVSDEIWTAPIILIAVGAVFTLTCFLGCCGALKEDGCMILSFAVLALILFFIEIGFGIACYNKSASLSQVMEVQFNNTMSQHYEREDYRDGWSLLQAELECCGTYGPNDWELFFPNKTVPAACCPVINLNEAEVCTVNYAYKNGCFNKLWEILDSKTSFFTRVMLGAAAIQVLTILFACCLCR